MVHLTDLTLKNFTCFSDLEISLSPGINVFIGANGTGKTHILKVLYSACSSAMPDYGEAAFFPTKLFNTFSTFLDIWDNYDVFQRNVKEPFSIEVTNSQEATCVCEFLPPNTSPSKVSHCFQNVVIPSIYIPVKEFLSHAQGFMSLVNTRRMAFDYTYIDLLTQAFLPELKDSPFEKLQAELLKALKTENVAIEGERFYLKSGDNKFEFSLVAEGFRKIALLLLLVRNGSISPGSVLFWDEPEANMNPVLLNLVVKSLLTFQRAGIQVFLTTHNYVLLKEFDLQATEEDKIRYFSLYFDEGKDGVQASFSDSYLGIENSEIARTYDDLFNREMERKFK